MKDQIGTHDIVFITFDTLRYDVAKEELDAGRTPVLKSLVGDWEARHTPGSFTYAAHQAFFAGFLPTPTRPGPHERLFSIAFPGSETIGPNTVIFDAPNIVEGLSKAGYRTICIGGVGFFNPASPLGAVLPGMFAESYWDERLGVTCVESTRHQVDLAINLLSGRVERTFLFLNISALHQPNCHYLHGATVDSKETHAAALRYVDGELGRLFGFLRGRGPALCILTSDHGTLYGEDGYVGHRCSHPTVWNVPYAEFVLS